MSARPADLDEAEAALGSHPVLGDADQHGDEAEAAGDPAAVLGLRLRGQSRMAGMAMATAATKPKEPKKVKTLNLLDTERDKEGWSTQKRKKIKNIVKKGRTGKTGDDYDVFLSYRVAADQKLVGDLYWRLVGMKVMDNGRERNLRVFWDKRCLRSGESWEVCCFSCPVLCCPAIQASHVSCRCCGAQDDSRSAGAGRLLSRDLQQHRRRDSHVAGCTRLGGRAEAGFALR